MTPDEPPIPDNDALAGAARRALGRLSDDGHPVAPWADVRARGRRTQRTRAAVAIAAALLVVVAGAGGVSALHGKGDHVDVAGTDPGGTTTTTTTTIPPSTTTSTPTTAPPRQSVGPRPATPTTVAAAPGPTPQSVDFDGTIVVGQSNAAVTSMTVGESVDVDTTIRNIADHRIWASSALVPTALATVCRGAQPDARSLWWMTNILVEPGAGAGRTGTFTPTDSYVGTVTCELDVVTTDLSGSTFDTDAGGDTARASIIGPVTGVPSVTITVSAPTETTISAPTTTPAAETTTSGP